jgi:Leucine-rich repeat (LRR) protein
VRIRARTGGRIDGIICLPGNSAPDAGGSSVLARANNTAIPKLLPAHDAAVSNPLCDPRVRDIVCKGKALDSRVAALVTDLAPLACVRRTAALNLCGTRIESLRELGGIAGIKILNLSETRIINVGLLSALEELEELDVTSTNVKDLSPLAQLPQLRRVWADYTPVADVTALLKSPSLAELYIRRTRVNADRLSIPRRDLSVFVD